MSEPSAWRRRVVLVAVLVIGGMTSGLSATAHATSFNFCGSSGSPVYLSLYPNDRCAHSVYRFHYWTRAYTSTTTSKCAIVKTDPGGFGGNATAPSCVYSSSYAQSDCGSPYSCTGYPTITNDGVANQYGFWGYANF